MYAPVFFPQVPAPPPAVLAAEGAILDAEGMHHVGGSYYADETDAARQRRWAAERAVREAARTAEWRDGWSARAADLFPAERPRVSTWVTIRERGQMDIAVRPAVHTVHRETIGDLRDDLATGCGDAAIVSAARVDAERAAEVAAIVRGFPGATVIALVTESDERRLLAAAVVLGRAGVEDVIDCRSAEGWSTLRDALAPDRTLDPFMRGALAAVLADIAAGGTPCTDGCARFLACAFTPRTSSAKLIAARLALNPTTLTSRFYRAGLPSPKRFANWARLVCAAHLSDAPGPSFRAIAYRLGASTPQSFSRTIRTLVGMSAAEFRRSVTGATMLDRFRDTLIAPYRETLRTFDPLGVASQDRRDIAAIVTTNAPDARRVA